MTMHDRLGANWRSMPEGVPFDHAVDPLPVEEFGDLDNSLQEGGAIRILTTFSGETFLRVVNYPIIVEAWERVGRSGSRRRRYEAAFTAPERKKLGSYHAKFRKWHLRTGTPRRVMLRLRTVELLQRAVAFFAEI